MDPVLKSLIWKEWQERKPLLFVCLAWILCGVVYVTLYELGSGYRTPVARYGSVCMTYSIFMSVFLAMRVSLSEVTQGTLAFTSALPIPRPRVAAVRLIGGIVSLAGPILIGALILAVLLALGVLEQVPERREGNPAGFSIVDLPSLSRWEGIILLAKITSIAAASTTMLFLVQAVIGARRRSETHVGFLGAAISFAWIFPAEARMIFSRAGFVQLEDWIGVLFPQSMVIYYGYGDGVGTFSDLDLANRIWLPLFLNLLILGGLGHWFTQRYGRRSVSLARGRKRRWYWPAMFSWISFPHQWQVSALIWINLRQSVPLALAGLVLAGLLAAVNVLSTGHTEGQAILLTVYSLPSAMWITGVLWATVVGAGIFAAELSPGLGHFWFSRPIKVQRWFWMKYLVGLCAVLTVLDGTCILLSWDTLSQFRGPASAHHRDYLSWSYIFCMPLLHAMLYSLAVLGVCWWKKPIRGAVTALIFFFVVSLVLQSIPGVTDFDPLNVHNKLLFAERQGNLDLSDFHFPLVYGTVCAIALFTAYVASRRVRRLEF